MSLSEPIATPVLALWEECWTAELTEATSQTDVPVEQWRTAGRKTKDKPEGESVEWWVRQGEELVIGYEKWLAESGWGFVEIDGAPLIEWPLHGHLGGVEVKGFLDAVMVSPEGIATIVDFKTGSRTPAAVAQLGVYRALLIECLGLTIDEGAYFMVRKMEMSEPESLARYTPEYVGNLFANFRRGVDGGIFLPHLDSHCFSCDVRDYCYAAGGVKAYQYDPDHPQFQPKEGQ